MRIHCHRPASSAWPAMCQKRERHQIHSSHSIIKTWLRRRRGVDRRRNLRCLKEYTPEYEQASSYKFQHCIHTHSSTLCSQFHGAIGTTDWQLVTDVQNCRKEFEKNYIKNQPMYWITDNPLTTIQQVLFLCLKWARKEWPHKQSLHSFIRRFFYFNPTNPGTMLQPNLNLKGLYQGHSVSSQRVNLIIQSYGTSLLNFIKNFAIIKLWAYSHMPSNVCSESTANIRSSSRYKFINVN